MNSYNKFQSPRKNKKSGVAAVIIVSILVLIIAGLSCALIYLKVVESYETKMQEYENLLQEYREDYNATINTLNNKLMSLPVSNDTVQIVDEREEMPDDYQPQIPYQESRTGFDAAEIASKTAASVIGIKVHVPAQNINSFWQSRSRQGSGSGIIISQDGYIVTNYHVVEDAVNFSNAIISVVFIDGEEHAAQYIGGDEINDLAVIKIDVDNLQYAELGSSDEAKVGDYVIAIGNPLGVINLFGSVTFGIISGVNRKIEADNVAEELLQTDAAINPGNSGGALINSKGEVIGINTVKIASTEYEGLGFAIPIDYARPIINSIVEYGYVKGRPTFGIDGMEITRITASYYRIPQGFYVTEFDSNSYAAGIMQQYDIITKVEGIDVYSINDINNIIKKYSVDDVITATVWRNNEYIDLDIRLSEKR